MNVLLDAFLTDRFMLIAGIACFFISGWIGGWWWSQFVSRP